MNRIPNWLNEKHIAHRGYFNKSVPENTLAAFELAIYNGFAIELDVQLLKCGTLIVFHDTSLKRMTGLNKLISDVTYNDIKDLKILDSKENIPTFLQVLELVNARTQLMIELKNETVSTRLEELSYKYLKEYKGEYIVQSFNPLSVKWFKDHANHVIRGQLACRYNSKTDLNMSFIKKFILRNLLMNFITKPDYINYDIKGLDSFIIKYLKFIKKPIYGYTAKSKEEYEKALELGVRACFEGFNPVNLGIDIRK